MEHSITGERSWEMDAFELPKHDVDKTMRNFPGYEKDEFYTMENIRNGDWSGSTDTDYNSHVHEHESHTKDGSRSPGSEGRYSTVNDTHGTAGDRFSFPTSSPRMADNLNEKPIGIRSPLRGPKNKRPG